MKLLSTCAIFLCFISTGYAQLTQDQKVSDFTALAALYDKNYGPYEWKLQVFGYDLLQLAPWLAQVNASTDDLSFYDICVRYVASLNDFHDEFVLPSYYEAYLPFSVDIYDGNVLIDGIDQSALPPGIFTAQIGDQMVSVDGTSVSDWMTNLAPYAVNGEGNPVSRARLTASIIIDRYQGWYTYANKVVPGSSATIVVQHQGGGTDTYTIPWMTIGIPLTSEGLVSSPTTTAATAHSVARKGFNPAMHHRGAVGTNRWKAYTGLRPARQIPSSAEYMKTIKRLQTMSYAHPGHPLAGSIEPFGSLIPIFNPPPGFQLRLGASQTDEFLSGTFPVGSLNIGYIRIPSFEPNSETNALQQFQTETTFFQGNTDGLVIDVMSNGGGDLCYTNTLLQFLIPVPFRSLGLSLRATEFWLENFTGAIIDAEFSGAPQWVIDLYTAYAAEVQQALTENRGMTGSLPVCTQSFTYPPMTDQSGNNIAFTKPIVVLTDNFTGSAAESFGATLQDAQRVTVYGVRTSGGGGNVVEYDFNATPFSEGTARVTLSLETRATAIATPGFPTAPYIENIGVYPDIPADYQTLDNLLNGGTTFVNGFSTAIANLVSQSHAVKH